MIFSWQGSFIYHFTTPDVDVEQQIASCKTVDFPPRYELSWLFISQLIVWVSAYFTVEFLPVLLMQSWVFSVNMRGLSTQPWGAPLLSTNIEEVWSELSGVCSLGGQIFSCRVLHSSPEFFNQLNGWDCVKCWAEVSKQHPDQAVLIYYFQVVFLCFSSWI